MQTLDLGNNEQISRGIYAVDGGYLAMTFTKSKQFRTLKAAKAWMQRNVGLNG